MAKGSTSPHNHPPYFQMISEAISTLKERTGSSQQAIAKFMEDKYRNSLPQNFRKLLSIQLKNFVKSERLVKIKNSYKISSTEKVKMEIKETQKKKGIHIAMKKVSSSIPKTNAVKKKGAKLKRLSQVKTPEVLKKKNLIPVKRNSLQSVNSSRPTKKAKN